MRADRRGDPLGVAAGGHDRVSGGQRGLRDVDAHAAAGAGDEPDLLVAHVGAVLRSSVTRRRLREADDPRTRQDRGNAVGGGVAEPGVGGTGRDPLRAGRDLALIAWTPGRSCATSWSPDAARSPRSRPACPATAATGAFPACAARRSPLLAGVSVEYYTRLERGNAQRRLRRRARGRSPARCSSTRPNVPTCSTWPAPPAPAPVHAPPAGAAARAPRRAAAARRDDRRPGVRAERPARRPRRQPPRPGPCTPTCTTRPPARRSPDSRRTTPASPSSTRGPPTSTPTGTRPPPTAWPLLRAEAGRNPDDRRLTELIGELTTRSDRFSALWATHDVRWHTTGTKHFHHRVVGDLSLAYEGLALTARPGPDADHLHRRAGLAVRTRRCASSPAGPRRRPPSRRARARSTRPEPERPSGPTRGRRRRDDAVLPQGRGHDLPQLARGRGRA